MVAQGRECNECCRAVFLKTVKMLNLVMYSLPQAGERKKERK